jgi:hypothetical protein
MERRNDEATCLISPRVASGRPSDPILPLIEKKSTVLFGTLRRGTRMTCKRMSSRIKFR